MESFNRETNQFLRRQRYLLIGNGNEIYFEKIPKIFMDRDQD
jgi:hypothetical protein